MTTAPDRTAGEATPTVEEQMAEVVMPLVAGYVGHRTIAMGLRQGMFRALAETHVGATHMELAERLGFDPFYTGVWCQAAVAAGVLERDGERIRLAPHIDRLLLEERSPVHVGPIFTLMEMPEMFDRFEASLASGDRTWWDEASADFIDNVAGTGRPYYLRLVPGGLRAIPGLEDALGEGGRVLETACGAGVGITRIARTYPETTVVGADGDAHSLQKARRRAEEAGVADRVELIETPLEDLDFEDEFTLATNNISMHECRDIDATTANIRQGLKPGGWFVISDVPFPESVDELRTVPGRVMTGIQYWEAQIDDQLLPRDVYDDLLARHGFEDIGSFELTPTHAVTYGRA